MKRLFTVLCSAALFAAGSFAQTIPLYENYGTVSDSFPIDAEAFANYGLFQANGQLPFDFQSTHYFTNRGTMFGTPGFRFAAASSSSPPFQPAIHFENEVGGVISAGDVAGLGIGTGGGTALGGRLPIGSFSGQIISPSYLLVSADTIINKGYMVAGAAGLVQLQGNTIDVSRSAVGVARLEASSTHFETPTNFFPDPAIYDEYWGNNNQAMGVGGLVKITGTRTNATGAIYFATNGPLAIFPTRFPPLSVTISNTNSTLSVYTNVVGLDPTTGKPTNITRQAAFVAVSSPAFTATVKWAPSPNPGTPFQTAVIELKMADTNVLTGDPEPSTLYIQDFMASDTNNVPIFNSASFPTTYRPANFILSRTAPTTWLTAGAGKGVLTTNYFFDSKDTNFLGTVTNLYSAYEASVDSIASQVPNAPGATIADAPGRVEITANTLDLTRTRIRGTGLVSVHAQNLIGTRSVNIDTENATYDVAVPNGLLNVQSIVKDRVVRLNGLVQIWSALWTNYLGLPVTNTVPDASGTGTTNQVGSQLVEIDYHMLIVDATKLVNTKPVTTHGLVTHANDVILGDPVNLVGDLFIDSQTFTLNSTLILGGPIDSFASTNAPHLSTFTIGKAGSLFVPNVANLGWDYSSGYSAFTNQGSVSANGILIRSGTFVSSGVLTSAVDGIRIEAQSADFNGANTLSAGDLLITGGAARFTGSTNASAGTLVLSLSDSLSDSGAGANNLFITHNGFQLPVKPGSGDLLGTTIQSIAPRFALVEHVWAGEDRGPNASGFQDNAAIGHLILSGDQDVVMSFRGAGGRNGMYVDFLELGSPLSDALNANNLGSALQIDPSLTIYFADSNVAADQLEQQSGGRLVHVDFVGPAQFVEVPVRSGGTTQMAESLRNSMTVDSDGDGIPNALDPYPLDADMPLRLSGVRANGQTSIALSWPAQPNVAYQVEFTTDLQNPNWQPLSTYTNSEAGTKTATVQDQLSGDHAQRYYRIRSNP